MALRTLKALPLYAFAYCSLTSLFFYSFSIFVLATVGKVGERKARDDGVAAKRTKLEAREIGKHSFREEGIAEAKRRRKTKSPFCSFVGANVDGSCTSCICGVPSPTLSGLCVNRGTNLSEQPDSLSAIVCRCRAEKRERGAYRSVAWKANAGKNIWRKINGRKVDSPPIIPPTYSPLTGNSI